MTRQIAGSITAQEEGGARENVMNGCGLVHRVLMKVIKVGKTYFFTYIPFYVVTGMC